MFQSKTKIGLCFQFKFEFQGRIYYKLYIVEAAVEELPKTIRYLIYKNTSLY